MSYNVPIKRVIYIMIFGFLIISISLIINNIPNENSHLIKFLHRLKENGVQEFIKVSYFKIKENLKLTITPPFSIVIILQAVILRRLRKYLENHKEIKSKAIIIIIIALLGFILNDTGIIFLIFMIQYLILDILSEIRNLDKITPLS